MSVTAWIILIAVVAVGLAVAASTIAGRKTTTLNQQVKGRAGATADLARVRTLLWDNKKIEAIKVYREETGAGLAEAKAAVEQLERDDTPDARNDEYTQVRRLAADGRKIQAIKEYRDLTGANLASAKAAVEQLAATGDPRPRTAGMDYVRQLAINGRMIEAIKEYRRMTGVGLAEAKAAVEEMR